MTTNQERAAEVIGQAYQQSMESDIPSAWRGSVAQALADAGLLTPDPQPRTLADLLAAGHAPEEYQWMQARMEDSDIVLTRVTDTYAAYVYRSGTAGILACARFDKITPFPGLPRMVWPKDTPEVEEGVYGQALWDMITKAIRDEKEYHIDAQDYEGVKRWRDAERALRTAMETNPPKESPVPARPEDVPEGEVWIVECYGDRHVGTRDPNEAPNWALARMDGLDTTFAGDELVDLVTRLVPEVKA